MTSDIFLGREKELSILERAWNKVSTGEPTFVFIKGSPGIGKTRLIQNYYSWLRKKYDLDNYWTDSLNDCGKPLSVIPEISTISIKDLPKSPWLWLGFRCVSSGQSESKIGVPIAVEALRKQMLLHMIGLISNEQKSGANKKLIKSGFGFVASFAIPGGGQIVEIINGMLDAGSDILSAETLLESSKVVLKQRKSQNSFFDSSSKSEQVKLEEQVKRAFEFYINRLNAPILIIIDDAHFIDELSVNVLRSLVIECRENAWPVLFISLAWDDSLDNKKSIHFNEPLSEFYQSMRSLPGKTISFIEHKINRLDDIHLKSLVLSKLPSIGLEMAELIAKKSGGNIDILFDLVDEIRKAPGWLDVSGKIAVTKRQIDSLPSQAYELAKKRINEAGKEMREILTLASGQGPAFDFYILENTFGGKENDIITLLDQAQDDYGFIENRDVPILSLVSEFRRHEYYEACKAYFNIHPNGKRVLTKIAECMSILLKNDMWGEIDSDDQERILIRLVELIDELKLKGKKWNFIKQDVLLSLGGRRLNSGDWVGSDIFINKVLRSSSSRIDVSEKARSIYVSSAYLKGDIIEEKKRINNWARSKSGNCYVRYISEAYFYIRDGNLRLALKAIKNAEKMTSNDRQNIEVSIANTILLWSSGNYDFALKSLIASEKKILNNIDHKNSDLFYEFSHAASLVLHDMEKNAQVIYHVRESIGYENAIGNIQQELICQVNFGDALWGVGFCKEAENVLMNAYNQAKSVRLSQVQDIAAICLANVLREKGEISSSEKLNSEGVNIAKQIGHNWDFIYG